MNGIEQRARHSAVRTAERRIDDLELVLEQIATEALAQRETFATHLLKQHDACQSRWEGTTEATQRLEARVDAAREATSRAFAQVDVKLAAAAADRDERIAAWEALTLWQRLRWLVRGVAR
jgi:hypothetical protein